MRRLWTNETKINWDDPIPEKYRREWDTFFNDLPDMKEITIKRCIKPSNSLEDPVYIIFSDGSNDAYGACAYARWKLSTGGFDSYLILSKNCLALKPTDINLNSNWQKGPDFLKLLESEWPISKETTAQRQLSDTLKVLASINVTSLAEENTVADQININKYSKFEKLLRVTARVLALFKVDFNW